MRLKFWVILKSMIIKNVLLFNICIFEMVNVLEEVAKRLGFKKDSNIMNLVEGVVIF